jgi:hypothetical protein
MNTRSVIHHAHVVKAREWTRPGEREAEMGGRMRRMGIAVAALSLLLVAGPATAALGDDASWQGLDEQIHPVAPGTTYDSSWKGLAEQIHPGTKFDSGWQGLDEEVHPVAPGTVNADDTEAVPSSSGSSNFPVFAVAFGLGLAALFGAVLASVYRRRTRAAPVG